MHERGKAYYAGLQAAGAIGTVLVQAILARTSMPTLLVGGLSFLPIAAGGLVSGFAVGVRVCAAGFILVVGFDRMFNVIIRTLRHRTIHVRIRARPLA